MPLVALWWAVGMTSFTSARDKSQWEWTAMILTPDWITGEHFESAVEEVRRKGSPDALDMVRLEALHEGTSVQTLHIGSYDDEAPVLAAMHDEFIPMLGSR